MPQLNNVMRECIESIDAPRAMKLWSELFVDMPQPKHIYEAIISLHIARTQLNGIETKLRQYSHCWLEDRGIPSSLPNELKPKSEKREFIIAETIGVSVNSTNPMMKPITGAIEFSISDAIMDAAVDGYSLSSDFVASRIAETRDRTKKYFRDLISDIDYKTLNARKS